MKLLILGLGFVATNLALLLKNDFDVYVLCRPPRDAVKRLLLDELKRNNVHVIQTPKVDYEALENTIRGVRPNVIINCIGRLYGSLDELYESHVRITRDLCQAVLNVDTGIYVFHVSSAYIVGRPGKTIVEEDRHLDPRVIKPQGVYEKTKVEGERVFMGYVERGLKGLILRPVLMYGLYNYHQGLNTLVKYAIKGIRIVSKRYMSMLSVVNLANAIKAMLAKFNRLIGNYVIISEGDYTINDIFDQIVECLSPRIRLTVNLDFIPLNALKPLIPRDLRHFVKYLNHSFKSRILPEIVDLKPRLHVDFKGQVKWYVDNVLRIVEAGAGI